MITVMETCRSCDGIGIIDEKACFRCRGYGILYWEQSPCEDCGGKGCVSCDDGIVKVKVAFSSDIKKPVSCSVILNILEGKYAAVPDIRIAGVAAGLLVIDSLVSKEREVEAGEWLCSLLFSGGELFFSPDGIYHKALSGEGVKVWQW